MNQDEEDKISWKDYADDNHFLFEFEESKKFNTFRDKNFQIAFKEFLKEYNMEDIADEYDRFLVHGSDDSFSELEFDEINTEIIDSEIASVPCAELIEKILKVLQSTSTNTIDKYKIINIIRQFQEEQTEKQKQKQQKSSKLKNTHILQDYYDNISKHPDQSERERLATRSDNTIRQVNDWFTNHRKRDVKLKT